MGGPYQGYPAQPWQQPGHSGQAWPVPGPPKKQRLVLWVALAVVGALAICGGGAAAWWFLKLKPLGPLPESCVAAGQAEAEALGGTIVEDKALGISFLLPDGLYEIEPRSDFGVLEATLTKDPNKKLDGAIRLSRENMSYYKHERGPTPVEARDGEAVSAEKEAVGGPVEKDEWGDDAFKGASVQWRSNHGGGGGHYVASVGCQGIRWTVRANGFVGDPLSGDVEAVLKNADRVARSIRELPES